MIRKIALGVAAALLIIGLPVAALGISRTAADPGTAAIQTTVVDSAVPTAASPVADQTQTQARRQLRIHAETGVPEGVTPTQTRQRLHTQDQAAAQAPGSPRAQMQGHGHGTDARGTQPGTGTGNQFGRNNGGRDNGGRMHGNNTSGTPGECTNPDGPIGTGPAGVNG